MNALREECQQLRDELIALRREFHRAPELGLHEYHTAARIERELDRCGIPHERVGETAVAGHLTGNGNGSGLVVLRADIDALPIQETNDVPYRSQTPGMMHACGHDAHTTCLLGAAKVLSAHRADFGGEVRFLFQPAEEIGQGARPLIAAGMLDDAQRVFGLHTASDLPAGTVGVKPWANNAGVDHFIIRIHGKSAHVSTPQLGVDALYIASELVVALQSIVTRMTSPVEPVLIGVGKLNAGTAYNAVAETAVLEGTTRMFSPESARTFAKRSTPRPHTSPPFTAARQRSNGTTSPRRSRTTPVCAGRSSASPTRSASPRRQTARCRSAGTISPSICFKRRALTPTSARQTPKSRTPASPTTAAISTSTRKRSPSARRSTRHTRCPSLIRSLPNNCFFR